MAPKAGGPATQQGYAHALNKIVSFLRFGVYVVDFGKTQIEFGVQFEIADFSKIICIMGFYPNPEIARIPIALLRAPPLSKGADASIGRHQLIRFEMPPGII